jgi:hypothetical protein
MDFGFGSVRLTTLRVSTLLTATSIVMSSPSFSRYITIAAVVVAVSAANLVTGVMSARVGDTTAP